MSKHSSSTSVSEVLYIMLAVSDLLSGIIYIPTWCCHWILALSSIPTCIPIILTSILGYTLAIFSVFTILFITINIYLSVIHPFLYEVWVTKKRVFTLNLFVWIIFLVMVVGSTSTSLSMWIRCKNMTTYLLVIIIIVMVTMHIRLNNEINRICSRVAQTSTAQQTQDISMKKKATKMGVKIMLAFLMCFVPISSILLYNKMNPTVIVSNYLQHVGIVLLFLNALLDPFIYYFRLGRIRSKVQVLFNNSQTKETHGGQTFNH
ncbi:lysophosphatidic acid receptor 4-like [Hydractinia symbiolongicarpus]|uniref:lysophosphatidic acid receptor 4-like n=1 Tax=Hydractinia symbiolongicarpus TaxID=13093 RepID=UPI00254E262F|nr:lysophosphatidic acid receptor 4-like [Hydractinia symbiolongicarpus]